MVATRYGVASLLAVVVIVGCSGGTDPEPEQTFTAADARQIATVRPVTPGWPPWPQKPVSNIEPDRSEMANKWTDEDKLANLVAQVWGSAEKAHEWMPNREVGEQTGSITKDEAVNDLGDEAWVFVVGGNGTQVTFHWRRGNLVVEAHLHCYGDGLLDVERAARAWADAIDEEASNES